MNWIRYWVYRFGFRPSYPSIFFSPSRHLQLTLAKIDFASGFKQVETPKKKE